MRKLLPCSPARLLLGGGAAQAEPVDREAELDRALAGRVAEAPVDCIDLRRVRNIADHQRHRDPLQRRQRHLRQPARTTAPKSMRSWDTMRDPDAVGRGCAASTRSDGRSRLSTLKGVVFLGDFVPYRRVRTGSAD